MPSLTRKEVEDIALLARLHLEPDELERMQVELAAILEHFQAIAAVDTAQVPAMTHAVPMDLRSRGDVPEASLPPEVALAGAPRRGDDLFVVPSSIAPGRPRVIDPSGPASGPEHPGTGTEP
jgi:aspartyl-tRNA(Asn)/glutamyl-tRNA(Gln) amidotransferase subunit C